MYNVSFFLGQTVIIMHLFFLYPNAFIPHTHDIQKQMRKIHVCITQCKLFKIEWLNCLELIVSDGEIHPLQNPDILRGKDTVSQYI